MSATSKKRADMTGAQYGAESNRSQPTAAMAANAPAMTSPNARSLGRSSDKESHSLICVAHWPVLIGAALRVLPPSLQHNLKIDRIRDGARHGLARTMMASSRGMVDVQG